MSRWVVHAGAEFVATHALASYQGRPEEPHAHCWRVAIRVAADDLGPEGYALDFHGVRELLEQVVAPLRGEDLSRHARIGHPTPTAERLAQVLAEDLSGPSEKLGGRLLSVSVWEGPDNRVDLLLEE